MNRDTERCLAVVLTAPYDLHRCPFRPIEGARDCAKHGRRSVPERQMDRALAATLQDQATLMDVVASLRAESEYLKDELRRRGWTHDDFAEPTDGGAP